MRIKGNIIEKKMLFVAVFEIEFLKFCHNANAYNVLYFISID